MWGAGGGGGVVVSEFSVAWGKRGEGGGVQGREGVQLRDSLMDEAVYYSIYISSYIITVMLGLLYC